MIAKNILTFILVTLSSLLFGQTSPNNKSYEYEICVYQDPKEQPKVLKNERTGVGDTTSACITGTIFDYQGEALAFAVINLMSLTDSSTCGAVTDSLGNFKLHLSAGRYKLNALFIGYKSLTIEQLQLGKGELRLLKLQLGNGGCFRTFLIQSGKPLSEKQLRKTEKRLKRKR